MCYRLKKLVLLCLALSLLLCSCDILGAEDADFDEIVIPNNIPLVSEDNTDSVPLRTPDRVICSNYGRDYLPEEYKDVYDRVKNGLLNRSDEINLGGRFDEDEITLIFRIVYSDNPVISWVEPSFSYMTNEIMGTVTAIPNYSIGKAEVKQRVSDMLEASNAILDKMPAFTDEFDKVHYIHDALAGMIDYDMGAQDRSASYAALLNGKATCEGYAKAYQFVLNQAGIEALMAFGDAGEAHSWNVVRINGNYYHSDLTWDDAIVVGENEDIEYLSHAYMTMNDAQISKSHTINPYYPNYELPECNSSADNFFVREKLVVTEVDMTNVEPVLSAALSEALSLKRNAVQFICKSDEVFDGVDASLLSNGVLDTKMSEYLERVQGVELVGKVASEDSNTVTYILKYSN